MLFREPMEYIMRSRPAFKSCSAPHPSGLRPASITFYGIAATGSYVSLDSLRDAPPQGKAFVQKNRLAKAKRSCLCWHYLSSRQVTLQVLSARTSLTSVFGMGTGGPSSQSIPTHVGCTRQLLCQKPELLTSGAPSGTRTRDPLIKSQLLYQLS